MLTLLQRPDYTTLNNAILVHTIEREQQQKKTWKFANFCSTSKVSIVAEHILYSTVNYIFILIQLFTSIQKSMRWDSPRSNLRFCPRLAFLCKKTFMLVRTKNMCCGSSLRFIEYRQCHRRMIYTEEKAKVVDATWGKEMLRFFAPFCTRTIWRIGWNHPNHQFVLVQIILVFKSSWCKIW